MNRLFILPRSVTLEELVAKYPPESRKDIRNREKREKKLDVFHRCETCSKDIAAGQIVLEVMGKFYHNTHFVCYSCKSNIGTNAFYRFEDRPFCSYDCCQKHAQIDAIACDACHQLIVTEYVNFDKRNWHAECFTCSECKKVLFANQNFVLRSGKPYCVEHGTTFGCARCKETITGTFVEAGGKQFHENCFKCKTCEKVILGPYAEANANFWCTDHSTDSLNQV